MAHLLQRLALAAVLAALADHPADAQQAADPRVGKRVITTFGTVLMDGNTVVDDAGRSRDFAVSGQDRSRFRVYRVDRVNGPWLWLIAEKESVKGWAPAANVIPFDRAIDYFTDQIQANPNVAINYMYRAVIRQENGELDIAIGDYDDTIRLDPRNELAYNNRGIVWFAKKEYDKAVANYSEAIQLDPKYISAYYNRGTAWVAKKEYDKALADYNESVRLDPKLTSAYNNRGGVWRFKREYDKAVADYNEAIRLDPRHTSAYYSRGSVWSDKKQYDKAVADYNEAIRLDPKYAVAYFDRAWIWATCPDAKHRDGKRAVESATKACELSDWKEPEYLDTLAASYAEAGDFAGAVEWQTKAIGLLTDEKAKDDYRTRLKLYQENKPYRDLD